MNLLKEPLFKLGDFVVHKGIAHLNNNKHTPKVIMMVLAMIQRVDLGGYTRLYECRPFGAELLSKELIPLNEMELEKVIFDQE